MYIVLTTLQTHLHIYARSCQRLFLHASHILTTCECECMRELPVYEYIGNSIW